MVLSDYLTGEMGCRDRMRRGSGTPARNRQGYVRGYRPIRESSPIDQFSLALWPTVCYTIHRKVVIDMRTLIIESGKTVIRCDYSHLATIKQQFYYLTVYTDIVATRIRITGNKMNRLFTDLDARLMLLLTVLAYVSLC